MILSELLLQESVDLFLWDEADLVSLKTRLCHPPDAEEAFANWLSELSEANHRAAVPVSNELMRIIVTQNIRHRGPNCPDQKLAALFDKLFPVPSAMCAIAKPSPERMTFDELMEHFSTHQGDLLGFFGLLRNPPGETAEIHGWLRKTILEGRKLKFTGGVLRIMIAAIGKEHLSGLSEDKLAELLEQELGILTELDKK